MNISALVAELDREGISLSLEGEDLIVNYEGDDIPDLLLERIRNDKQSLVGYLKKYLYQEVVAPIVPVAKSEFYPLSSAQYRLWILSQFQAGLTAYNMPGHVRLTGSYNAAGLRRAVTSVLERHEILRTVFRENAEGLIQQQVLDTDELNFSLDDVNFTEENDPEQAARAYIQQDSYLPFDLVNGPLLRIALLKLADNDYLLYYNMHHIISDGWSMDILARDIAAFYKHQTEALPLDLPPLRIQFKDHAAWQQALLESDAYSAHREYWLEKLSGRLPVLDLPSFKPRPVVKTFNGRQLSTSLDGDQMAAIRAYITDKGGTLFMFLVTSLKVLFYRYTGQEDIIIGSPTAGRDHPDLRDQIGCYVNPQVIRNFIAGNRSFNDLYGQVKENLLASYDHQMYPLDKLIEELAIHRDTSRNALFDVVVVLQNTGESNEKTQAPQQDSRVVSNDIVARAKFDMEFEFIETGNTLKFNVTYNTDIYDGRFVTRLMEHYQLLVQHLLLNGELPVDKISYLSEKERRELLYEVNNTVIQYPELTAVDLFEAQVLQNPGNIALRQHGQSMTYAELNSRANMVAAYLVKQGAKAEGKIGILCDRGFEMVIALMAVLKSGASYVPIDPEYPVERQRYIAENSCATVMLTNIEAPELQRVSPDTLFLSIDGVTGADLSAENLQLPIQRDQLAYTIYTSGSTGNPKGVMIEHYSLMNLIRWVNETFDVSANDKMLCITSICFDLSVYDVFGMLACGGSIFMATRDDLPVLEKIIASEGITFWDSVPSTFNYLVDKLYDSTASYVNSSLRLVFMSGDWIPVSLPGRARPFFPNARIISLGGATEGTIWSNYYPVEEVSPDWSSIPYGKPLTNNFFYILDNSLQPVPKGVRGELFIGGIGVARGYDNDISKTDAAFIKDPFTDVMGGRMYRTGDLGRWREDGNMEFMGRKDNQVKIRGFRVEMGEIETMLARYDGVRESVIGIVKDRDNQNQLCAYLVCNENYDRHELKKFLKASLPGYMVPDYFVVMDALPLNSNGKIDRKCLPLPDVADSEGREIILPETEMHKRMADMWRRILKTDVIGINESLYDLGGDSLKAIRLINEYHRAFDVKLTVEELFTHTTLEAHAALIGASAASRYAVIPVLPQASAYPVSDAQRRLWIISQLDEGSAAYNMPGAFPMDGSYDVGSFKKAIWALLERHEILRTVFRKDAEGAVYQVVMDVSTMGFSIGHENYAGAENPKLSAREYMKADAFLPFDLENGPLLRVSLLELSHNDSILYYNMHHIISDGWSMDILARDILAFYKHFAEGAPLELPPLQIQYKDYAAWQLAQLETQAYAVHKKFWLDKLSGELPVLDLSPHRSRPSVSTYEGRLLGTYLNKDSTAGIRDYVKKKEGTLFMFLVAALKVLFHRYTGQEDIIIGSAAAGREHADLKDQIGFYINTLTLRSTVHGGLSFDTFFEQFKRQILESYKHQMYPLDRLLDELDLPKDTGGNALFNVRVVLQNIAGGTATARPETKDEMVIKDHGYTKAKFDMLFIFDEVGDHINLTLSYNTDIYEQEIMMMLLRHYQQLVKNLLAESHTAIGNISYFPDGDKAMLHGEVAAPGAAAASACSVLTFFEAQALRLPENTALVFGDTRFTYRELDHYSNQLAAYLQKMYQIQPDDLVGMKLPSSHWSVVAILGILKSGAAYVPIDMETPVERIQYMAADTGIKTLIILSDEAEQARGYQAEVLVLDSIWDELITREAAVVQPALVPDNLAYVIYTSGSTGQPKGVMVTHGNLLDYVQGLFTNTGIGTCSRFALMSSLATDLGNTVLYGSLLSGGTLHLLPKERLLIAEDMHDYFREHAIDCIKIVPSHWNALLRDEEPLLPNRMIVFGGDVLPASYVAAIHARRPELVVVNHYGPTETTIGKLLTHAGSGGGGLRIPIGKPFSDTSVYVVDKQMHLCPVGIPGELLIGGKGVARGYLNKPELTEKQFITRNYSGKPERLYRTGDLVRMLPDGNIEFLGRIDNQVKIRGYRIELGDVEAAIQSAAGTNHVLVIAREISPGNKELAAYYTSPRQHQEQQLREYLLSRLPAYMIPNYFIWLKEFPLTSNGKINRKALPAPEQAVQTAEVHIVAPRNEQEKALVEVWESVLKRNGISVQANFFQLGGDSIKGILIVSRLKQKGYQLKIADLMQTPVLSAVAEKLSVVKREIKQSAVSGEVLLTPVQQAFLSSAAYPAKAHYNQSVALESASPVDLSVLDKSLEYLVKHHDALRMVFTNREGKWRQQNKGASHKGYALTWHDLSGLENHEQEMRLQCDALQAGTDLENGPLFKAALFRLKQKDCLILVIHHLVVDGVSWRILLEDLQRIYHDLSQKLRVSLPEKTDSFQRWAKMLAAYAQDSELANERPYWEAILSATTTPLCQETNSAIQPERNTGNVSFTLDETAVELLQTKVHRAYNTEINDVLLTALALAIGKVYGNRQVVLSMEGHGREAIMEEVDITRTVGWFTSIYPFLLSAGDGSGDFKPLLVAIKESLRKLPRKGIGYGILQYLGGGFSKEPEADIIFNYLGDFGGAAAGKDNDLFYFSNEYKGADASEENDTLGRKLGISGILVNNTIGIAIKFNKAVHDTAKVTALAGAYKAALEFIISQLSVDTGRYLTPADLTYKELSVSVLAELNYNNNVQDVYRLSPLQEGLYYHWISGNDKATYCAQHSYRLNMTGVPLNNIRKSFELLVARHSILRTGFVVVSGELLQVVRAEAGPVFTYEDVTGAVPPEKLELYISDYKAGDKAKGFDVRQDSLIRLSVLYLGDNKYELIWCNHHILMDGWCSSILVNEFYQILSSLNASRPVVLQELTPYAEYIRWLDKIDKAAGAAYWEQYLSEYSEKAVLPFAKMAVQDKGYLAGEAHVELKGTQMDALKSICAGYNLTENIVIQSAWGYLLSKYNNTRDAVFGTVVSGRPAEIAGVENMVGLFINTIPARVTYTGEMKVSELLQEQQRHSIAGLQHHYLSLSGIQSKSGAGKELFDHIYVFENYAVNELGEEIRGAIAEDDSSGKIAFISGQSSIETHYDFDILAAPLGNSIHIALRYNANVYRPEDIKQMRDHLENVLSAFIAAPDVLLKDISCITAGEAAQLRQFNSTTIAYPANQTICSLFRDQVSNRPGHLAVVFEDQHLTYRELDQQSDLLAAFLQKNGEVVKGDLVGIQLHRGLDMSVAIMAVLKTGAAYVPLDMQYLEERIKFIQEDSQYKICVNKQFLTAFYSAKETLPAAQSAVEIQGADAAYGIYTSGSTGLPKGVLNSHAGLYNRLLWMRNGLQITSQDILLQKTPYTFDVSVWELLMPAVTGCRLVFARPEGHKDPEYLQQLIHSCGVTVIHFVPSMLGIFLENLRPEFCGSLRHVVCSGEALPAGMVEEFKLKLPGVRIHNLYGPTEAAIDVTSIDLTDVDTTTMDVTIGKPVANTKIYIVDKNMSEQPIGVCGELLIEGVQVAKGYLNRPDLNQEKFIPSPFIEGERVYRTGDVAKWLPGGEIAYAGRMDSQVKIRGNRIELGEIEAVIIASGYVDQAVVLVKQDSNSHKHLFSYITPRENYSEEALQAFVKARLPEYMVPARMHVLEAFPLTSSGKINKSALAEREDAEEPVDGYVAPESGLQEELAIIWENVLGCKRISIRENFFRAGGDSILAIRLVSRINGKYQTNLTIAELYEFSTIEALAVQVAQRVTSTEQERKIRADIEKEIAELKAGVLRDISQPAEIEDIYPMTDIQKGMVILSNLNQQSGVYHDQFAFQIPLVDLSLFSEAFSRLVWKHPALRTRLAPTAYAAPVQILRKEEDFAIVHKDLRHLSIPEKISYIQEFMVSEREIPFQFDAGLLWRINLFTVNDHTSVFIFQFHHAILDGWSLASMNTELFRIYRQLKQQQPVTVEKLKATNRDAVIGELYDKRNPETISFWQNELSDFKRLDIFGDKTVNLRLTKRIEFDVKRRLEHSCRQDDVALKTVIYGAFIYALRLISYESDFVTGVLSNNRPVIEDGEKLLGCFLNTVPVRCRFDHKSQLSVRAYFKEAESDLNHITKHSRLTLYEISRILNERPAGGSPFFDVMFNLVNFHVYNTLELDADEAYKKSHEENGYEDSFAITNTSFDITVNALGNALELTYKLRKELKHDVTLEKIHHYVATILDAYINNASDVIGELDYLTDIEKQLVLRRYELPAADVPTGSSILDLFEAEALRLPENTALVFGDTRFTYRELDHYSNQLAAYLQTMYQIQPDDLVGMKLPSSHLSVVAILGILKSGAAYVPIDTETPVERIQYMAADTGIKTLIILSDEAEQARGYQAEVLVLDSIWDELITREAAVVQPALVPDNLAYVIYTSGSTGQPKGVMVTHGNLLDYVQGLFTNTGIGTCSRFALMSSLATDLGNTVLYGSLLSGGTLHLLPKERLLIAEDMHDYFREHAIDCIKIVPSHWNALLRDEEPLLPNRMIVFGGDVLPASYVAAIHARRPELVVVNHYGPTETTIGKLLTHAGSGGGGLRIPIGKPFSDTSVYVVDKQMHLCPVGIPGELLIGGKGLARGYLNKPELTEKQFITRNYSGKPERLYRTGDLVRMLPDGNIEFLGRIDNQVKIRGYRIELGDVEAAIRSSGLVDNAVVVIKQTGTGRKQLVGYVIPQKGYSPDDLYAHLSQKVPDYMIPVRIYTLEEFPLTANGKIDRKKFAELQQDQDVPEGIIAPRNETESALVSIWEKVLECRGISVTDNFFRIGGDSLLILKLKHELEQCFQTPVNIVDLFSRSSIADQAGLFTTTLPERSEAEINELKF